MEVSFVTENGKSPQCDAKMLTGWTQKILVRTFSPFRKFLLSGIDSSTGLRMIVINRARCWEKGYAIELIRTRREPLEKPAMLTNE